MRLKGLLNNDFALAAVIAIAVIILGVGLGWENNKVVPANSATSAHYVQEPHNRLAFTSEWDGPIYLNLAQNGYTSRHQANFFPLYPLTVHVVHLIIRSTLYSALIVAWACFVGATYFYIKIIKRLYKGTDSLEALRATLFFVLFPTGVFLIATYTESLFAFLALGTIYYALRKKCVPAAIMAALSTATHVNGLFVVLLMGMILLEKKLELKKVVATMAAGCLGIIGYMAYQSHRFGTPLAFLEAQQKHSWLNFSPWHLASELATFNGLFVLLVAAASIYWWRRRKSFAIYSILYLLIVFVGGKGFSGMGRYALVVFPLQIMLYEYFRKKPTGYALAIALTSILWAFFTFRYMGGYTGG